MDLIRAELVRLCSSIHPMKDLSECETFVDNLMRQRRFNLNIKDKRNASSLLLRSRISSMRN